MPDPETAVETVGEWPSFAASIADHVRARRRATGLSQKRLAVLAGVSSATVQLIEQGGCPRHSEALRSIRDVLEAAAPEPPSAA